MAPPNGPSSTYGRPLQSVAAPTQTAEWVALYTYPSSAALYSQLPICEAALAPIRARAPGRARTSRYAREDISPIAYGGFLPYGCGHHPAADPRFCGEEVSSAIQQRLAAQAGGNVTGFAEHSPSCLVIVQAAEILGVVEQAVGHAAGGGVLARADDRGGKH